MNETIKLVILVGPSGSGKSTVEAMLVEKGYAKTVSHTTRPKRHGEIEGKDYYFLPESKFLKMKNTNQFMETVNFAGNYYGLSIQEFFEKAEKNNGKIVLVVEPKGLIQIIDWVDKHNNRNLNYPTTKIKIFPFYLKVSKQEAFKRMSIRGIKDAFNRQQKDDIDDLKRQIEDVMPNVFLMDINTEALVPESIANIIDFTIHLRNKKN